ncbi:MAG: deoxyhypusine synthase family protein [Nitrospirae bacterium]|nr:deoxyhypusine synthase family protein [Nitrospirota bacterium]MBI5696788.1 deoxyhypusine synthase family protein [Nitrospirota bacterium]
MKFTPIDTSRIKTYSLAGRKSKVEAAGAAKPFVPGSSFRAFLGGLPGILAADSFRQVASAVADAKRADGTVALGMGAHPVKVGLSPVIIDLMERGIVNALATNGAVVVHDFEMAYQGRTSEDVDAEIGNGSFGMAEETGRLINEAVNAGVKDGLGIGAAIGRAISEGAFPFAEKSLFAAAYRLGVPATVHVAIGTDIVHMHPAADGASIGEGSMRDFKLFSSVVASLEGGVYINLGSAVLMPEVFLKAVTLARNLGSPLASLTTVNMDFIQGYRPSTNVVRRPTLKGGRGYSLTGHHEIMFPLLAAAVLEELEGKAGL